jgi:hypothetical protein
MKYLIVSVFTMFLNANSFSQEYYEFRKEEKSSKGLSITPLFGITIEPEGGSALTGILKVDYTFGKFISAGVAYAYLSQATRNNNYFYNLVFPEHSGYLTIGGQYPFDNDWFSIDGTAGLGYIFSGASTISSYFDIGLGFKVLPKIIIKPKVVLVQDRPIAAIGCQIKF